MYKFAKPINTTTTTAYIGLGSNLEEPIKQVLCAIKLIDTIPDTQVTACSSLYKTSPVGPQDQPDFINAVLKIETKQPPRELLAILQYIESEQGRVRRESDERWGPRIIDLDILLYGDEPYVDDDLIIPHKEMHRRSFVLIPLAEIDPFITLPSDQPTPIQELINRLDRTATDLDIIAKVNAEKE